MSLPEPIRTLLGGRAYALDSIGKSSAQVLLFEDMVLKIRPATAETEGEAKMLTWLRGKVPVPEILAREQQSGMDYLLMSRCQGEMACAPRYMENPREQAKLLAQGLELLWGVDIQDCPVDKRLPTKLKAAKQRVALGLVDVEDAQPGTFGPGGFRDPETLLQWLETNQPEEELALSHGDYCLPNVFFQNGRVSGLIDLGRCGVADKWCDIALCQRSLDNNYGGIFDGVAHPGWEEDLLFRELGIRPDREKLRYYILLDELF